mmetsp:Transcript_43210/g.97624  ORF Transcript_43210/g.97624 Transcript_43210/m.97624 type:complete len:290 (-) Transcript_43210:400-1269(-)
MARARLVRRAQWSSLRREAYGAASAAAPAAPVRPLLSSPATSLMVLKREARMSGVCRACLTLAVTLPGNFIAVIGSMPASFACSTRAEGSEVSAVMPSLTSLNLLISSAHCLAVSMSVATSPPSLIGSPVVRNFSPKRASRHFLTFFGQVLAIFCTETPRSGISSSSPSGILARLTLRVGLMSDTSFLMLAIISEMASPRPFLSCIWISCNFTLKKVLLKPMMADFASATCFCCAASSPTSPTIAFSRLPSLLETPTIEASLSVLLRERSAALAASIAASASGVSVTFL